MITPTGASAQMIPAAGVSAPLRMRSSSVSSGKEPIAANRSRMPVTVGILSRPPSTGPDAASRPAGDYRRRTGRVAPLGLAHRDLGCKHGYLDDLPPPPIQVPNPNPVLCAVRAPFELRTCGSRITSTSSSSPSEWATASTASGGAACSISSGSGSRVASVDLTCWPLGKATVDPNVFQHLPEQRRGELRPSIGTQSPTALVARRQDARVVTTRHQHSTS